MNPFGNGSQGALNVTSGITYLPLNTNLQYTTVNVGASGTIRPFGTTGSVLYICATESITINGTINTSGIVNYGNNTWGVTIDGETFTSPGVANGGYGGAYGGNIYSLQSNGFGGGGSGSSVTRSGTTYLGGNGGDGSTSPSGGAAATVSRTSNGTSANRNDAQGTNGGSGVAFAYLQKSGAVATTVQATGGSGGQGYGANGADGSGSFTQNGQPGSWAYNWYGGGGGGGGGRAGQAGVHLVLKSPSIIINGTLNTSGTNGTNGGNGGRNRNWSDWQDYWGMPGGGGGGGNAGSIKIVYNATLENAGTISQSGGTSGAGGIGGPGNTTGYTGSASNGSTSTLTSTQLPPIVNFTSNVTTGARPLTVNFTSTSVGATSYLWTFGDGTTSTQTNPTKVYSTVGSFTVSLKATNAVGNVTETKTNFITTTINEFSRSISGGLIFGGGASRKLLASRAISGTLIFGGGVRAVVLRDVEGLQDKRYLYKVYDPDGNYVEVWKDVISELNFTNEINTIGSTTTVELARNSDTLGTTTAPLLTEDGQNLLTEDDYDILVSTQSRNQVGSGSSVDYNNRVDITVFYGSVEPLLAENDEPLLTEDDEELLADVGAPNGRSIFTGFISEINSRYGNTETTIVQLTSYGWDLDQFPITTSGGATTVPFNSYDPSNIASEAIDKFIADSASYGTYTTRTDSSISPTGTVVSYTFRANTYGNVLDKILQLMPSNWYYRIGLGDNTVYYSERSATPHHLFYLGKHIKAMDLKGSIMESTNRVLFTGGGDPALFINREEVPADRTRRRLEIISDSRVTLTDSAEIISDGRIDQNNKQLFRTTVEILAVQYDIESIEVGQTVGFRNFGDSYVDSQLLQIVGLSYSPDSVQLQLETKPPTINKRLEDLRRNLTITENTNVPDTPS